MKFLVLIVCLLIPGAVLAQDVSHPFIPQYGKLLIIGQQKDSIDGYIQSTGTVPGGIMVYTSIQSMDGLDESADHDGGIMNAQYYINQYPHMAIQLGLYMVGALDNTLKGRYDDNIVRFAGWIKNTGCPIYLRIGYEFDLPDNNYDPQKYAQVFRYIVDHLRAQGVENVAYVWHSAAKVESQANSMDWYPGDDYVDWFAVSLFNPIQIEVAQKFFAIARRHGKPAMIAESAPVGLFSTETKKEWFRHYFDFIKSDDIKIVSYINSDWNSYPLFQSLGWGDSRIQNDPKIQEMWDIEMDHGFLQYSLDLSRELNS